MNKILYPSGVDKSQFSLDQHALTTKYGLPEEVVFCKKCVISNQRPNSAMEHKHTKHSIKKNDSF